jgi:Mn2+/Fe2+ NRAMP family transporter
MRRFARDNGLAIFFLAIFLASVLGQAIAGHNLYNEQEMEHAQLLHQQPELISFGRYLTSSNFAQAMTENWQSEYLQFMLFIFFASWFAQSVSGWSVYNQDAMDHKQPAIAWVDYLHSSDFWQDTLQNWQSEFLAVGSIVIFSVFLRQRGSPQSKPVGEAHKKTAVEG